MRQEKLRIHHGIGSRVLLDSDKDHVRYTFMETDAGYAFAIYLPPSPNLDEILRLKDEINLFIFREDDGVQIEKVWFYTGDGALHYNDAKSCLNIVSPSSIAYQPGSYEM